MAIPLNTSEPPPEFNEEEAINKYLPLVIKHAYIGAEFNVRELYSKIGLAKHSRDYKIYCNIEKKLCFILEQKGWIKNIQDTNRHILTLDGLKEKTGANKKEKERQKLKDKIDKLTRDNLRLNNWDIRLRYIFYILSAVSGYLIRLFTSS